MHPQAKVDPQEVVRLRREGWPITAIGDHLGVSKERVRQILRRDMAEYAGRQEAGIDRLAGGQPATYIPGAVVHGCVITRRISRFRLELQCGCGRLMKRYTTHVGPSRKASRLCCNVCRRRLVDEAIIADYRAGLTWGAICGRNDCSPRMVTLVLRRNGVVAGSRTRGRTWNAFDIRRVRANSS